MLAQLRIGLVQIQLSGRVVAGPVGPLGGVDTTELVRAPLACYRETGVEKDRVLPVAS
jgi:hypothetical protein